MPASVASIDEDLFYFQPDFDPHSVTVPQLRNILVSQDVQYPSSAKKAELIDIFNEKVAPRAKKALAARARTKRTTRGIKDVPASQEDQLMEDDEDVDGAAVTPAQPVKKASRRTTRAATEEVVGNDNFLGAELASGRGASRKSSAKQLRAATADAEDYSSRRRTTRYSATPAPATEVEPEAWHKHDDESPFTADNPFQSGSSPVFAPKKEGRRKTLGPVEHKEKRKSDAVRRRTDFPVRDQDNEAGGSSSRTFEMPVKALGKTNKDKNLPKIDAIEPGEEFTPEEQLELDQAVAESGKLDILPQRQNQIARRSTSPVQSIGWVSLFTFFVAFAAMWRQEKLNVGYCGIGAPSREVAGVQIPEWADALRPQCELCPPHAFCRDNLDTDCEQDFILRPHPLSLGGLVPLPPTCEPDSEKARKVKQVADKAIEELRERTAKFECGEPDESGNHIETPEIGVEELKDTVSKMKRRGMSDDEFDDLWRAALGDLEGREEVTSATDS
jgi:hypothetical protein